MKHYILSSVFILFTITINCISAQNQQDSIRGFLDDQRNAFDVYYYNLVVDLDINERYINGSNEIQFKVTDTLYNIQIDLFNRFEVTELTVDGISARYSRKDNAIMIPLSDTLFHGKHIVHVKYQGDVVVAKRAPWDGGFVFSKDKAGYDWIGVACEGFGASSWWPLKDHLSDEPDSMDITILTPKHLAAVSNGVLRDISSISSFKDAYHWHISYPINSYNVTLNIANYSHFSDYYVNKEGDSLALDYYVLPENLITAKFHFEQTKGVLESYEHYFSKYPYWNDGFALVETPYLGMEHQGAIAYGNKYRRGYLGMLSPDTLEFDYIIVHETGHEYWGNSISVGDHAEMWIHEGFTTYMESLYVEYHYDKAMAIKYLLSQRNKISNQCPMKGPLGVNYNDFCSSDMYYKGAWFIHTIRTIVDDDKIWWELLKSMYLEFENSIVNTEDILGFMNEYTDIDLRPVFEQYLEYSKIPIIEYTSTEVDNKLTIAAKWNVDVNDFEMPVWVHGLNDAPQKVQLSTKWTVIYEGGQTKKKPLFDSRLGLFDVLFKVP